MFRKKLLILVSIGVVLPLLVLTYLQYRSLAELQNKTKGAFKDNLRQGLPIVQQQMRQRLQEVAIKTLEPIGTVNLSSADELEKLFANTKRSHPEVVEVFAFDERSGSAYVYSDKFVKAALGEFNDTLDQFDRARMEQSLVDGNRRYLFVHQSCPNCPRRGAYLFYPLPNSTRSFVGVLFNESFVSVDLIAGSINKVLNIYHGDTAPSSVIAITITDENNHVLFSNAAAQNGNLFETNFDRPFSNWKAVVALKNTNLDELARNSFLHSAGATLLVLVFLLCGIALTIRAADREARLAQAKSNFVANVSHELKTPLARLSLLSDILARGRVNSEEN